MIIRLLPISKLEVDDGCSLCSRLGRNEGRNEFGVACDETYQVYGEKARSTEYIELID